jgi:monovalent cation/hydrogen antiporter
MDQVSLIVLLLAAVAILVEVAERIAVPYPIVLVLGGLALAVVPGLPALDLAPELILLVFIPPLVLSAAWLTPLSSLRNNIGPTVRLSLFLVLFTIAVVAIIFQAVVPNLGWIGAIALGAIVSPTDELAATTILHRLRVPPRVVAILEAESLFNDGTALVIYRSAVLAAAGASLAVGDVAIGVGVAVAAAAVIGLVVAFVSTEIFRRLKQPPVIVALTLVTPYVAYLPADRLGFSGIIAVVVAGVALSRWSTRIFAPETRVLATATWQMVVLLLNGFAFILIGLALPTVLQGLGARTPMHLATLALLIAGAVVFSRLAWFFVTTFAPWSALRWPGPKPKHARAAYTVIPGWAGLRGAVSLAAAISLPTSFPERDLIIFLTFVVILVTLVGPGLTLPLLVQRFGLRQPAEP